MLKSNSCKMKSVDKKLAINTVLPHFELNQQLICKTLGYWVKTHLQICCNPFLCYQFKKQV